MSQKSDAAFEGANIVAKILGGLLAAAAILSVVGLFGFLFYRGIFYTWTDNYHIVFVYDARGGGIDEKEHTGYIWGHPWWQYVHTIDSRPMQVCINANSRVLNCKLVKFNRAGLGEFLKLHGRDDYDAARLNPILMSYAYEGSGKNYSFLTVIRELKSEEKEAQ